MIQLKKPKTTNDGFSAPVPHILSYLLTHIRQDSPHDAALGNELLTALLGLKYSDCVIITLV